MVQKIDKEKMSLSPYLEDMKHDLTDIEEIERFFIANCEDFTDEYREVIPSYYLRGPKKNETKT